MKLRGRWLTTTAAAASLSVCSGAALAQDAQVRVQDAQGQPVAYAEVEIQGPGGRRSDLTDADGRITVLPQETLGGEDASIIRVSALDGRTAESTIAEVLGRSGSLVLNLAASQVGDIVVVGRRISRAFAPQVVGQLAILTDPAARADPLLAVDSSGYSTNTSGSADLELRGNRAGISRVYFNDVPLYETVRGSNVDRTTRGFSIFNIGMVGDVEIYPSNPPAYLSGSAGGALRVLPGETATPARSALLSTAAAAYNQTFVQPHTPGRFVKAFASATDMSAAKALNPDLGDTIDAYRSLSVGATGRHETQSGAKVDFFAQADGETGRYPLNLFGFSDLFASERRRVSAVVTAAVPLDGYVATVSGAVTRVSGAEHFGALDVDHDNTYGFASLDLSGKIANDAVDFRMGLDAERIRQSSVGYGPEIYYAYGDRAYAVAVDQSASLDELTAYGFASTRLGNLSVHAGFRQTLSSSLSSETALQAGLAYTSNDGRSRTILSGGRYFGAEIPPSAMLESVSRVTSEQIAVDQTFRLRGAQFGGSLYAINENTQGREVRTRGVELTAKVDVTDSLSATAALASVSQDVHLQGREYPGEADLGYILKSTVRYQIDRTSSLNVFVAGRPGSRFTEIIGQQADWRGRAAPIFSADQNGQRLGSYWSIDVSFITVAEWFPGGAKPLVFVSASNIANRANISGFEYSADFGERSLRTFPRRSFTLGAVWNF